MDFKTLSGEALKSALAIDFSNTSDEALEAALTDRRAAASALFALEPGDVTVAQVADAEALNASVKEVDAEKKKRDDDAAEAGKRFAEAKAAFAESEAVVPGPEDDAIEVGDDGEPVVQPNSQAADAADTSDEGGDEGEGDEGGEGEGEGEAAVTASAQSAQSRKIKPTASNAKKVASRNKRPDVKASNAVVITAAADVPGFSSGSTLEGIDALTKAMINRVKGFSPYSERAAAQVRHQSGGAPVLNQFGVASLGMDFGAEVTATKGNDYAAVRAAIKQRIGSEGAITAAGWCAPSETIYSYISDYVVDGLVTVPEVSAPRGGLMTTTGPQRSSQGQALTDFGWTQTETQAEAGQVKPLEVIDCPDFVDHRLDAVGYGYTIPFLTQKAYPELITDALKFASVLWAHRMNRRKIADMVALSDVRTFEGYGPSVTDALEALAVLAVKERRKWNLGRTAVMEVKVPEFVLEVYRADISRRNGMNADSVTDQMIMKHFTDRHLAVEFVADWQELGGENIILPGTYDVLIFPPGTFVSALEDVVNLSAFYDTASVTVNQYTGVFFEQGYMLFKAGYGSSRVTMPINTAGQQGALNLNASGDWREGNGSF